MFNSRSWIASVAKEEFKEAYNSFESTYVLGQDIKEESRECTAKSVTLIFKKRRPVQVVHFDNAIHQPISATISDGEASIRATFSEPAIDAFKAEHQRDINSITGGHLLLNAYRLIFELDARGSKALSIDVLDFKYRGTGVVLSKARLSDVLQDEEINVVLSKLQVLITGAVESPSVRSQALSESGESSSPSVSQAGFSTQFNPLGNAPRLGNRESSKIPANHMALMAILKQKQSGNQIAVIDRQKSVLVPLSKQRSTEASAVEPKANSWPSSPGHSTTLSRDMSTTSVIGNASLVGSGSDQEPLKGSHENANHLLRLYGTNPINPSSVNISQKLKPTPFFDHFQEKNPFGGAKRVPRRHVRIPKKQQDLLDSPDAWYEPAETGRVRYANIPPEIHASLTSFMLRKEAPVMDDSDSVESSPDSSSSEEVNDRDIRREVLEHDRKSSMPVELTVQDNEDDISLDLAARQSTNNENEEHADSDEVLSWSPSDRSCSTEPDMDPIVEKEEHIQEELSSSPAEFIESDNATPYAQPSVDSPRTSSAQILDESFQNRISTRKLPIFPPSSAAEEEIEIASPYAVGDQIEEITGDQETNPMTSQPLPSTAPQSSRSVQVERTPQLLNNTRGSSHDVLRDTITDKFVHSPSKNFSDERIPGTFLHPSIEPLELRANSSSHMQPTFEEVQEDNESEIQYLSESDDQSANSDEEGFQDALVAQQLPEDTSIAIQPESTNPKIRQGSPNHEVLPELGEGTPTRSTDIHVPEFLSSPAPLNDNINDMDKVQVPTTQLTPVNSMKRSFSVQASPGSTKVKNARLKIASKVANEKSTYRSTKEMARENRRLFKESLAADKLPSVSNNLPASAKAPLAPALWSPVLHETSLVVENDRLPRLHNNDILDPVENDFSEMIPQSSEKCAQNQLPITEVNDVAALVVPVTGSANQIAQLEKEESLEMHTHENRDLTSPSNTSTGPNSPRISPSDPFFYYEDYVKIYKDFSGSKRLFTTALCYIQWLSKGRQVLHQSLYDDFIRVYASDYTDWARKQRREDKPLMLGCDYYHKMVVTPLFRYGVITNKNFEEAMACLDPQMVKSIQAEFSKEVSRLVMTEDGPKASSLKSTISPPARQVEVELLTQSSGRPFQMGSVHSTLKSESKYDMEQESLSEMQINSLDMRASDVEVRAELLQDSAERAPSRRHEKSPNSSSIAADFSSSPARRSTHLLTQAISRKVPSAKAPSAKAPFFETASQLQSGAKQHQVANTTTSRISPPSKSTVKFTSTATITNDSSPMTARRKLPWEDASSVRPLSVKSVGLPKQFPAGKKALLSTYGASRSFDGPSTSTNMQNLTNPFMSDDIPRRSRKRTRAASPILGTTSEQEDEEEEVPAPKRKQTSTNTRSTISSVKSKRMSHTPSSVGSRVTHHEVEKVLKLDEKTKVLKWMTDLQTIEKLGLRQQKMIEDGADEPEVEEQEVKERAVTRKEAPQYHTSVMSSSSLRLKSTASRLPDRKHDLQHHRQEVPRRQVAKPVSSTTTDMKHDQNPRKQEAPRKEAAQRLQAKEIQPVKPPATTKTMIEQILARKKATGVPLIRRKDRMSLGGISGSLTPGSTPAKEAPPSIPPQSSRNGTGSFSKADKGKGRQVEEPERRRR